MAWGVCDCDYVCEDASEENDSEGERAAGKERTTA